MIETIDEAIEALRVHTEFCQRLVCNECDLHADIVDLLMTLAPSAKPVEDAGEGEP